MPIFRTGSSRVLACQTVLLGLQLTAPVPGPFRKGVAEHLCHSREDVGSRCSGRATHPATARLALERDQEALLTCQVLLVRTTSISRVPDRRALGASSIAPFPFENALPAARRRSASDRTSSTPRLNASRLSVVDGFALKFARLVTDISPYCAARCPSNAPTLHRDWA